MRKIGTVLSAVALALVAASAPASAQISLSLGGGPSFPVGDLGDIADTGFNGQVAAAFTVPAIPVGLRADAMINQFGISDTDIDLRILSGTINGILQIPMAAASPYLIGGVGMYNWDYDIEGAEGEADGTDFGANIGLGVRFSLPGLSVFGEARMHNIFSDGESMRFVPVTIGLSL